MPRLNFAHLVYTRVEPAYSPQRKNGFQTVYVSPDVSAEDRKAIESRIQCFAPSKLHAEQDIAEYQFFWVPGGAAVIVQTIPIDRHPEVIDAAAGRTGHFIAHALILEPDEFERIRNDAFALIKAAQKETFIETVEELVAFLDKPPANGSLSVSPRRRLDEDLAEWDSGAIEKWALAAQSAEDLMANRGSVLLMSKTPDDIYDLLSVAHYLLDRDLRRHCTFNTYVDGCTPKAGMYWAVGASKRLSGAGFVTVDVDARQMTLKMPESPKASPYSMWLQREFGKSVEFSEGMTDVYTAQIAAECLANQQLLPDESLNEATLMSFREAHLESYKQGVISALTPHLGPSLSQQLAPTFMETWDLRQTLNVGARQQIDPSDLIAPVYSHVLANHDTINDWQALFAFAQAVDSPALTALAALRVRRHPLNRRKYRRMATSALNQLHENGEFSRFVGEVQHILPVGALVTSSTAALLAEMIDPHTLDDDAFVQLISVLIQQDVDLLNVASAERAKRLTQARHIKKLARLLKKADTDSDFAVAFNNKP